MVEATGGEVVVVGLIDSSTRYSCIGCDAVDVFAGSIEVGLLGDGGIVHSKVGTFVAALHEPLGASVVVGTSVGA